MSDTPKDIPLTAVADSSFIESHGYDPDTQVMRVKFKKGDAHDYYGVSPEKYVAFTGAKSHGTFLNQKIRPLHNSVKVKL